jgi:hypothetical protein
VWANFRQIDSLDLQRYSIEQLVSEVIIACTRPWCVKAASSHFHDIAITNPEYGVRDLWAELKAQHQKLEILAQPRAYGIGLLWM